MLVLVFGFRIGVGVRISVFVFVFGFRIGDCLSPTRESPPRSTCSGVGVCARVSTWDHTVGPCLGPYGDPGEGGCF